MIRNVLSIMLFACAAIGFAAGPAFAVKDFNIRNAGTYHFTVKGADGNIGIGSASPGQKLDVNGTVRVTGNVGIGTTETSGARLVIVGGNVGIGTITATAPLSFGSSLGNTKLALWENSVGGSIGMGIQGAQYIFHLNAASDRYSFYNTAALASELMTIKGTGNVGIGSVTPGASLDIQGTARMTAFTLSTGAAAGYVLQTNSVGVGTWVNPAALATNTNDWTLSGTNVYLTTGSNNVGIGTSTPQGALVVTNGNVGIGTWAPQGVLDVQGTLNRSYFAGNVGIGTVVTPALVSVGDMTGSTSVNNQINVTSLGRASLILAGDSANTAGEPGSAYVNFIIDGTLTQGLIGLTQRASKDPAGSSINNGGINALDILGPNDYQSGSSIYFGVIGRDSIMTLNMSGVGIGTLGPLNQFNVNGGVGIGTGNSAYLTTVAPAGGLIVQGNVGMGSLTPGTALDVQGTVRMTALALSTGASSGYVLQTNSVGVGTWVDAATLATNSNGWTLSGSNVYTTTGSNNVGLGTSTPQGGLAVTNGNVGIGTWSPRAALDVQGTLSATYLGGNVGIGTWATSQQLQLSNNMLFPTAVSNTNGNLFFGGDTSAGQIGMRFFTVGAAGYIDVRGSSSASALIFRVDTSAGSQERMRIFAGGNIGIGTIQSNPGSRLSVAGNVGIGTNSSSQYISTSAPTGGMIVEGNVGIGTWLPRVGLDVGASSTALQVSGASDVHISGGLQVDGSVWLGDAAADNLTIVGTMAMSSVRLDTLEVTGDAKLGTSTGNVGIGTTLTGGNTAKLAILGGNVGLGTITPQGAFVVTNGNVGIGTWAPQSALDVQGSLSAVNFAGNLGVGTFPTGYQLYVNSSSTNVAVFQTTGSFAYLRLKDQSGSTTISNSGSTLYLGDTGQVLIRSGNWGPGVSVWGTNNVGIGSTSISTLKNRLGIATDNKGGVGIGTGGSSPYLMTSAPNAGLIVEGNVGLATTTPQAGLVSMNNVGIGTWTADGGNLIVNGGGNVGIGSAWPGARLDIQGTARMTAFNMPTGAASGYVLQSDSVGVGTWVSAASLATSSNDWTLSGSNVYTTTGSNNVGIGTSTPQGGLVVTNGNVGIGTWTTSNNLLSVAGSAGIGTIYAGNYLAPSNGMIVQENIGIGTFAPRFMLEIKASSAQLFNGQSFFTNGAISATKLYGADNSNYSIWPAGTSKLAGNIGIGTTLTAVNLLDIAGGVSIGSSNAGYKVAPSNGLIVQGYVGVGSTAPGEALDIQGTARMTAFNMPTGAASGYVLQSDSVGVGTWVSAASLATSSNDWTLSGSNVYTTTGSNNVGIGTSTPQGGLVVTNGNVGIGTWVASSRLSLDTAGQITWANTNNIGNAGIYYGSSNYQFNYWNGAVSTPSLNLNGPNIGIGTTTPQTRLAVVGGNVGIGTWTADGGRLIVQGGYVGIGTIAPGTALGVVGNVGIGSTAAAAYKLQINTTPQSTDGVKVMSTSEYHYIHLLPSTNSGAYGSLVDPGDQAMIFSNSAQGTGNLVIAPWTTSGIYNGMRMDGASGNLSIGTKSAVNKLTVAGGVGVGTGMNSTYLGISAPAGGLIAEGNVGIGTWLPRVGLDVGASSTALQVSGASDVHISGGLQVDGSVWLGDAAADNLTIVGTMAMSSVRLDTLEVTGDTKLGTSSGNVGIGTTLTGGNTAKLAVLGGNVGIGTTTPQGALVVTNGNVGIGTWAPSVALAVVGSSNTTGAIFENQQSSSMIRFKASSGSIKYIGTDSSGNFNILANNASTKLLTLTEGGNLGIGSASPGQSLDVQGTIRILGGGNVGIGTSKANHELEVVGSIAASNTILSDSGFAFQSSATTGLFQPAVGDVRLYSANTVMYRAAGNINYLLNQVAVGPVGGAITGSKLSVVGNIGVGTAASSEYFLTPAPNGGMIVEGNLGIGTITADNGRLIVKGGNVGIGSVIPGAPLDIQGTARMTAFALTTGAASGYVLQTNSVGVGTWVDAATLAGGSAGWTAGGGNVYTTTGSDNVGLGTSTPQGGLVVTNGNVGIGTWAPNAKLRIKGGDIVLDNNGYLFAAGTSTLRLGDDDNINFSASKMFLEYSSGNLGIGTVTPQGALVVTNGNVGIGTWAPGAALDVAGTVQHVYVNEGGNLGIGIASPQLPLHIASSTASNTYAKFTNSTSTNGLLVGVSAGGNAVFWEMDNVNISFATNNTNRMSIQSGGNIGIGTGSAQTGLAVTNGNVGIGTWTSSGSLLSVAGGVGVGTVYASTYASPTGGMIVTGCVGIGTWLPAVTLEIDGSLSLGHNFNNTYFIYNDAGVNNREYIAENDGGVGTINTAGAFIFGSDAALSNVATTPSAAISVKGIYSSANVGVGTFNPTSSLVVAGGVGIGTNTNSAFIQTGAPNGGLAVEGNIGVGTTTPQGGLVVTNGNVGIGTWTADRGRLIVQGGNVGIATVTPGTALDVQGTARMTAFALTTGAASGYVLQTNSVGVGTWVDAATLAGGSTGWTAGGGNVYTTTGGNNVGIGTTTPQGGLIVTNGNVGIGTFAPDNALVVYSGNVGIGSNTPSHAKLEIIGDGATDLFRGNDSGPNDNSSVVIKSDGNVGIGSLLPNDKLVVNGNMEIISGGEFRRNLYYNGSNFVATTSSVPGLVIKSSVPDSTIFQVSAGTTAGSTATMRTAIGMDGTSGNVGIGTAIPTTMFEVGVQKVNITSTGNIGIGTNTPQASLVVTSGKVGVGTWIPSGGLTSVRTTSYTTDATYAIHASDGANPVKRLVLGYDDTIDAGVIASADSGSAWKDTVINAPGGNVGIGTFALGSKLAVHGGMSVGRSYSVSTAPTDGLMVEGNVGIGTTTPQGGLVVTRGNVGIGTWAPQGLVDMVKATALSATVDMWRTTYDGNWGLRLQQHYAASQDIHYNFIERYAGVDYNVMTFKGGNVGVSSTAPGQPLDIQGTARMTAFTLTTGAASGYVLQTNSVGVGTWVDAATLAGGSTGWTAGGGNVYTTTGSNNVGLGTTTPQGGLVVTNGNVGIGTWAPQSALDVQGTLSISYFAGNVGIGTTSVQAKLVVLNGNVGIGTWAPSFALDVKSGRINVTQPINAAQFVDVNDGTYYVDPEGNGGGTSAIIRGNVGIATLAPKSKLNVNGGIGIGTTLTNGAYLYDYTAPSGGLIVQGNVGIGTFNPFGGNLIINGGGNVGIGSITPGTPLDVQGTARMTEFRLTGNGAAAGNVLVASGTTGIGTWMAASTLSVASGAAGSSGQIQYNNGGALAGVSGSGVDAQGNMGIGSASPGEILDVQGTVRILGGGNLGIGTTSVKHAKLEVTGDGGTELLRINDTGQNDTTPLVVMSNGNVGIGSVNPAETLTVSSATATTNIALRNTNAGGKTWQIGSDQFGVFSVRNATDTGVPFKIFVNMAGQHGVGIGTSVTYNTLAVVTTTGGPGVSFANGGSNGANYTEARAPAGGLIMQGNLGIGTYNPVSMLEVAGGVGIGTNMNSSTLATAAPTGGLLVEGNVGIGTWVLGAPLTVGTGNSERIRLYDTGVAASSVGLGIAGNDFQAFLGPTSNAFTWRQGGYNGTTLMKLTGVGNVGIGSLTPGQPLDIQGTARMTAFTLSTGAASGYVLQTNSVGVGTWVAPSTILSAGGTPGGNTNAVQYNSAGSFAGADNNFAFDGTNVGIGTTLTGATGKLNVIGGNVGIGTVTPQAALVVTNGNVGIGTWETTGGSLIINSGGNVGIGTVFPEATLAVNGFIAAGGADAITSNAKSAKQTTGWKIGLYATNHAIGVANWTVVNKTSGWVSVFTSSNPANNATSNLPDSNAVISLGLNGTGLFKTNIGIGTIVTTNQLTINGAVGIGTANSSFVTTVAPGGGLVVEGNVGLATTSPQAGLVSMNNVGIGTWTADGGRLIVQGGNVGVGTNVPASSMDIRGSIGVMTVTKSGNYTATASDYVILVDASSGAVTITLPSALTNLGRTYVIKKTDSSANAVIISGAQNIDASSSVNISAQYQSYTVVSNGTQWWII